MGYRPSLVTEPRNYGEQISGFNYNTNEFMALLDDLFELEYYISDHQENFYEIENSEVEKLKEFDISSKDDEIAKIAIYFGKSAEYVKDLATSLQKSLLRGLETEYSKKLDFVAIEWF